MAELLSPREIEDVSKATSLAEHGNGSRLRDLVHDDKDFAHHTAIINAMLNVNQDHLQNMVLHEHDQSTSVNHVSPLKLDQAKATVDGQVIVTRSVTSNGRAIYREVWNDSKQSWEDSGSCPRPSGVIPPFMERKTN